MNRGHNVVLFLPGVSKSAGVVSLPTRGEGLGAKAQCGNVFFGGTEDAGPRVQPLWPGPKVDDET